MNKAEISRATLGRIPLYLKYLKSLPTSIINISATSIANGLGLGEVQVRKDLGVLCGFGKPKTGYRRVTLTESLEQYLTAMNGNTVIIGAGQLGKALLDYNGFDDFGIRILAAFERHADASETSGRGKPILPMERFPDFCREHDVRIGVIAVPPESAQEVCNIFYDNGIKAIWCFAQCQLYKPADVVIRYENLALSLAHLKTEIGQP